MAQAEHRYFDALLYEQVLWPSTEARLRQSNGFCGRHVTALLHRRHVPATALLYAPLLAERRAALAESRRRGPRGAPPRRTADVGVDCPACEAEDGAAGRACTALMLGLAHGSLEAEWRASEGLCWPHYMAARGSGPRAALPALDEHEEACLARLAADVEDLVKSYDYRFTGERGAAAESAWRRVVAVVAGRRGDDPEAHAGHAHPGTS